MVEYDVQEREAVRTAMTMEWLIQCYNLRNEEGKKQRAIPKVPAIVGKGSRKNCSEV